MTPSSQKRASRWGRRIVTLYVLPLASLGLIAWIATTQPPVPILIGFIAILGWPALATARTVGECDGLAWALAEARAELAAGRAALAREEGEDG